MRTLLWWLFLGCGAELTTSVEPIHSLETELPSDSLYQLPLVGVSQTGVETRWDAQRGHPVVVSMFYASCPSACPMLIADLQSFENSLSKVEKQDLRVLLVSLDPERDTPEALAKITAEHGLDDRWTLLRVPQGDVREVAASLGIRYRPAGDGEMNHSSVLTLLDREGRPLSRLEGLGKDAASMREALKQLPAGR